MTSWKFTDLPKLRLNRLAAPALSRLGFFWQSARASQLGGRASLPLVGEQVRLQTSGVSDLGVYFARVRLVGPRKIALQLEDSADSLDPLARQGTALLLSHADAVMISYDRGEAVYHFQTRVAGPQRGALLAVLKPREVTRVQRRNYYRLPLQSPTTFRMLAANDRPTATPLPARLVNLSGGGAMVAMSGPMAAGTRALLRVPSGKDGAPMDVVAEALDCHSTTNGRKSGYLVRFRFPGPPSLTPDERESIIAYIFEQQRILLRLRRLVGQAT